MESFQLSRRLFLYCPPGEGRNSGSIFSAFPFDAGSNREVTEEAAVQTVGSHGPQAAGAALLPIVKARSEFPIDDTEYTGLCLSLEGRHSFLRRKVTYETSAETPQPRGRRETDSNLLAAAWRHRRKPAGSAKESKAAKPKNGH